MSRRDDFGAEDDPEALALQNAEGVVEPTALKRGGPAAAVPASRGAGRRRRRRRRIPSDITLLLPYTAGHERARPVEAVLEPARREGDIERVLGTQALD